MDGPGITDSFTALALLAIPGLQTGILHPQAYRVGRGRQVFNPHQGVVHLRYHFVSTDQDYHVFGTEVDSPYPVPIISRFTSFPVSVTVFDPAMNRSTSNACLLLSSFSSVDIFLS